VVDRTPPPRDIHKGFQLVIDGTLTGGAPPQGPAPAPKQLEAEELQRAENAAAEVLNSNRTDTWRCAAGLSGTAELLRPDTTAGRRRMCGPLPYRTDGLGESVLFAGGVRTTCGCVAAGGGGVMSWAGSVGAVVSWKRT